MRYIGYSTTRIIKKTRGFCLLILVASPEKAWQINQCQVGSKWRSAFDPQHISAEDFGIRVTSRESHFDLGVFDDLGEAFLIILLLAEFNSLILSFSLLLVEGWI